MRAGHVDTSPVDDESRLDRDSARQVLRRLSRMLVPYRRPIIVATFVPARRAAHLDAVAALRSE